MRLTLVLLGVTVAVLALVATARLARPLAVWPVGQPVLRAAAQFVLESQGSSAGNAATEARLPLQYAWLSSDGTAVRLTHDGEDFVFFPESSDFPATDGLFFTTADGTPPDEIVGNPEPLSKGWWRGYFNYGLVESGSF